MQIIYQLTVGMLKPDFINTVQTNGLNVIARIANNPRIWQFVGKHNTLESLYTQAKNKNI